MSTVNTGCLLLGLFLIFTVLPCILAFSHGWSRGWEDCKTLICERYHR